MELFYHVHPLRVLLILVFMVDVVDEEAAALYPHIRHGPMPLTKHHPGANQRIQAVKVRIRRPWLVCRMHSPVVVANTAYAVRPSLSNSFRPTGEVWRNGSTRV